MAKGLKTGGRVKGVPNKLTQDVKSAIESVASGLGGADRMLAWCKEDPTNERIFWSQIFPKLLPKDINLAGQGGEPLVFNIGTVFKPKETE